LAAVTKFPAPDELEHISYAAHLQETGQIVPRFEQQKRLMMGDFTHWDVRPNYIGHPSPFYLLLGLVLDRSLPPDQAVRAPRLVADALLVLGVGLALATGFGVFRRDWAALLVFCAGFALNAELLSIAREATNDTLAVLGGALAYCGVGAVGRRWSAPVSALGLLLALWAKANAGLDVGVLLGLAVLVQRGPAWRWLGWLVLGGLIGVAPYVQMLLKYRKVVPISAETLGNVASLDSFALYVPVFLLNLGYTWGFLQTGRWPITAPADIATIIAFWAMIGGTVVGARLAWRWLPAPSAVVSVAAPAAFFVVLPIHLWFSARGLGYSLPAASFRYYLPLWPALAHAMAYAVFRAPGVRLRITLVVIAATALGFGWVF
jgi:hypothetical protein